MQLKRIITGISVAILGLAVIAGGPLSAQTSQQSDATAQEAVADTMPGAVDTLNLTVEPVLTTGVMERMPVDSLSDNATVTSDSVFFWTRVNGVKAGDSTSITHVWSLDGQKVFTRELPVKGPGWRTWTYNVMGPQQKGDWTVTAYGPDGTELTSVQFRAAKSQEAGAMEESTPADTAGTSGSPGGGK